MTIDELIWMHSTCEHGVPLSEDCDDCDEILYAAVEADLMEHAQTLPLFAHTEAVRRGGCNER